MNRSKKIENRGGVLIIIFVGLLAVMKVVTSGLEEEIAIANYKHVSYSNWYNAKSIKQVLKEGEHDYLISLVNAGLVAEEKSNEIQARIQMTNDLSKKYDKEKTEILEGSANIPKSSWTQDLEGEFGKIIGLKQWEKISANYFKVVAKMDIGILFLQIGVVFGVLGIIVDVHHNLQRVFVLIMAVTGLIGILFGFYGYSLLV